MSPTLRKRTRTVRLWASCAGALLLLGGLGFFGWVPARNERLASTALIEIMQPQDTSGVKEERENAQPSTVESSQERLRMCRDLITRFPKTAAAVEARLLEGALLLQTKQPEEAIHTYQALSTLPRVQKDPELLGRSLEGLGFSYEQRAEEISGPEAVSLREQALRTFRTLENVDQKGLKELGMYHQARCLEQKGERDKAIELLRHLSQRLRIPETSSLFVSLGPAVSVRLAALDPDAQVDTLVPQLGIQAHLRRYLEQLQRQAQPSSSPSPTP